MLSIKEVINVHEQFVPLTVSWFLRAYVYTGSIGDFRYRYATDKENGLIHAAVYSRFCYEVADDVTEQDFPWTEDGVKDLQAWMQQQYESFCK